MPIDYPEQYAANSSAIISPTEVSALTDERLSSSYEDMEPSKATKSYGSLSSDELLCVLFAKIVGSNNNLASEFILKLNLVKIFTLSRRRLKICTTLQRKGSRTTEFSSKNGLVAKETSSTQHYNVASGVSRQLCDSLHMSYAFYMPCDNQRI